MIYIEGGPSPYGWSGHADFRLCPAWWAWKKIAKVPFGTSEPLARGTLMAVGISHWRAALGAKAKTLTYRGTKPAADAFLPMHDAVEEAVKRELDGKLDKTTIRAVEAQVHTMLDVYIRQPAAVPIGHRILHVEEVVEGWIEDPLDGTEYPITARPDMITVGPDNKIYWWDDKVAANPNAKLVISYSFSGQFIMAKWLGPRAWPGRFGDARLSLTHHDGTFDRPRLKAVPAMVAQFPTNYAYYEREKRRLIDAKTPAAAYPKAEHAEVCVRRYGGPCPAIDLCAFKLSSEDK